MKAEHATGLSFPLTWLAEFVAVVISASTNLSDWTPIFTNPPTLIPMYFVSPRPSGIPQRFYRVFEQR